MSGPRAALRRWLGRLAGRPPAPLLAVVVPADEPLRAAVRAHQADLASALGLRCDLATPPHVTLKLGFAAADPEGVARWLEALAAGVAPFEAEVAAPGAFDEGILFLDVARAAPLLALQRQVVDGLAERFGVAPWPLEQGDRFHFHVTLATGLAADRLALARRRVEAVAGRHRLPVERLTLLRARGDAWEVFREAPLGGGSRPAAGPA